LLVAGLLVLYALFDGEKVKTEISRVVMEKTQRTLVIAGTPKLSVWPDVGIAVEAVTLSEHASDKPFIALDSARISVAVVPLFSRALQVRALELNGLKVTLIKNKDGSLNIADLLGQEATKVDSKAANAKTPDAEPMQIDVKSIRLTNTQLTWRDDQAGTRTEVSNLNLSLDGVRGDAEQIQMDNFAVQLDVKSGETRLMGQLSSPVTVNVLDQSVALNKLSGSVSIANPAMPMKQLTLPIQGALQVNGKAQTAALDLRSQFDESKIVTNAKVSKFSPLAVEFDLDIDQLNVDKYLPPKPVQTASTDVGAGTGAANDMQIDLSALKGHTVNGGVRIGALQVSNLKLAKINAKINLAAGKLAVAPFSLNLYDGSANGSISANAEGNAITVRQTLAGISINPLMKDLLNKDLLEGRGSVVLDIATRGATVGAMKKALSGTASLSLKDGAIKGINLAQTLRDAKAKLGQADSTQAANAGQKTDFSELTGSFKIVNGVAHNDDLSMKSPFIRLGGVGDIDVGAGQMNYLAKAAVVASGEGQGGAELAELKGLVLPVRVSGAFDKLSYQIEWGAMLSDATKARVDEKVKEVRTQAQEALKDKARDALKGLLGR
jgi:AsmA protein